MASEDITPIATDHEPLNLSPSEPLKFSDQQFSKSFPSKLLSYRKTPRFTDVIVKAKNIAFPCHKVVLSAASPFFEDRLQQKDEGTAQDIVSLSKTSPEILETLVDFFYTGGINITFQNVQAVTTACDEMKLHTLKEACDQFLADQVQPANCFGLMMFAKMYGLDVSATAATECMKTMLKDILQLAPVSQYKALNKEELLGYIYRDDIYLENEDLVFRLVVKWIEADQPERAQYVEELLHHVRLPLCTVEFLCDVVEKHPFMKNEQAQELLHEAKNYQLMPHRRSLMVSKRTQPREYSSKLVVMGSTPADKAKCFWFLDGGNKWKELTKMPGKNKDHFQACVLNDSIIVTGGRPCWEKAVGSTDAWEFSLANLQWKALPPMSDARSVHCTLANSNKVFVIGGYHIDSFLGSVECLGAKRDQWISMAPMLVALNHPIGISHKGKIFIFGGIHKVMHSCLTQMYDVTEDRWYMKACMPTHCERGSVALYKDYIYVLGDENQVCMKYDPTHDQWRKYKKPNLKSFYPSATVWGGKILLGGGTADLGNSSTDKDEIEEYDPEQDKWSTWKVSLPICTRSHTMFPVRGLLFT